MNIFKDYLEEKRIVNMIPNFILNRQVMDMDRLIQFGFIVKDNKYFLIDLPEEPKSS